MSDDVLKGLQSRSREKMHEIWQKAKNDELDDLSDEEKNLAQIMLDHEDEFFNQFELADKLKDHEYDPDTEANPF
ncbi:MAG: hypothetical protein KAV87_31185 [Desulfobacteraceae bacterium]|nr:hypothetical protein [Desulfobacteraceae bacterium]